LYLPDERFLSLEGHFLAPLVHPRGACEPPKPAPKPAPELEITSPIVCAQIGSTIFRLNRQYNSAMVTAVYGNNLLLRKKVFLFQTESTFPSLRPDYFSSKNPLGRSESYEQLKNMIFLQKWESIIGYHKNRLIEKHLSCF